MYQATCYGTLGVLLRLHNPLTCSSVFLKFNRVTGVLEAKIALSRYVLSVSSPLCFATDILKPIVNCLYILGVYRKMSRFRDTFLGPVREIAKSD